MTGVEGSYRRREIGAVAAYGVCLCLTLTHFVHNGWYQILPPDTPLLPKTYAPEVYRVAIPALTRAAMRLSGVHQLAWIYAGLDFLWSLATVGLLYRLAVEGMPLSRPRERSLRLAVLLLFMTLAWNWIVPWQRPETTPSGCYLALALLCVSPGARNSRDVRGWVPTLALLLASLWQALVRADVAFVFGAALCARALAGFVRRERDGKHGADMARGAAVMLLAAGVQAYLQLVRFPHRVYDPRMPMFSFRHNLSGNPLSTALLALLPFLLAASLLPRCQNLSRTSVLAVVAAVLYLPLWVTVALISEVRVYVPFLTLLCLPVAEAVSHYLIQESPA